MTPEHRHDQAPEGRSGDRPRVVHVINNLKTGGAETMLARLVSSTGERPVEHIVLPLTEAGTAIPERVRAAGALTDALGLSGPVELVTAPFRLAKRLRRLRPDLVNGWLLQGNLAATLGTAIALSRAPLIWNVRWALYDMRRERLRTRALVAVSARLSGRPTRIVFNSRRSLGQHAAIGYAADRAIVIPNGFDLAQLRPDPDARAEVRAELGLAPDATVVGMLARYHPVKDHAMSLHAAARLVERGVNAYFVYAGTDVDDMNHELTELVKQLGLTERVRLLGERRDVARLYAALDLYWMSSWARGITEGFPNVIAEAMACGVPCIATDVGDAAWIIGNTGRIVPPRDPRALADATAALLDSGAVALARMGVEARQRIEREYSLESVVAAFETLYRDIIERAHSDRP